MAEFDPRVTPVRGDLAARFLEGTLEATRFVEGELREVIAAQSPLRRRPAHDAPLDTEALHGDRFMVYDDNGEGWCWGQLRSDGYVGWIPSGTLGVVGATPTHRVSALRTLAFPGPSIKLPPTASLPLGGLVNVVRQTGIFAVTAAGEHLPARHLQPVETLEPDFVAVAERFVGAPYLWGGKTVGGIDCSGLVQIALMAAGTACPRDSDMQETSVGREQPFDGQSASLQRGDLIFWPGHVAIVCAPETIIHANAFHMEVVRESAAEAITRISAIGSPVRSVRRFG